MTPSKVTSVLGLVILLFAMVIPESAQSFSAIPEKSKTGMVTSANKLADAV